MIGKCVICASPLTGRQRKYCSQRCISKRYYEANKEKTIKHVRAYREANLEKCRTQVRTYREVNREKHNAYQRAYIKANKERVAKSKKAYYEANRRKIAEHNKAHYDTNFEQISQSRKRQYRKGLGLPEDYDLSKEASIETIMKSWLLESNVGFIQQCHINFENSTWTRVDFYIPEANVCLYVDGDYWHSLEGMPERDKRINESLEQMNYNVIRLTGSEIRDGIRPIEVLEMI